MASSMRSPPTREERQKARPWSEITPTSVVPPPMSTIIDPNGSATGARRRSQRPSAPRLATRDRRRRCSPRRGSLGARRGRARGNADHHLRPAREAARTAMRLADEMLDHLLRHLEVGDHSGAKRTDGLRLSGVLPSISLASSPTARTLRRPLLYSIATTDGSLATIPTPGHRRPYWRSRDRSQFRATRS